MRNIKKLLIISLSFIIFFVGFSSVEAATISLSSASVNFGINQEFEVDVKIDSEEDTINASQARIEFPANILELLEADRDGSAFNFWVEEPVISNEDGTVEFVGGTAKGISGSSLQVLKLKFKAIGAGSADISVSNAVVTASDGKGTNVLSTTEGVNISIGTKTVIPTKAPIIEEVEPIIQPEKIIREAVIASELPEKPKITLQLYPDQSKWYSHLDDVIALWELPDDVIQVATRLSQARDEKAGEREGELFNGKNFGTLEEGIWYIRVQFKNNIGWGELAYYQISIDATAPVPFEIEIDNAVSDNPTPKITFETQDALSGIAGVDIFIDGVGPITSTSTSMTLPPQTPGVHKLIVRVKDKAGNSVEDDLEFEVIPLSLPTIDFLTRSVSQDDFIFSSGRSIPNIFVDVSIKNDKNQEIFVGSTMSNELGNWNVVIEEPLSFGKYSLQVIARDERGATSFPTKAEAFKVKGKIIFSVGFIDVGWFEIFLFVAILAVSGISIALFIYNKNQSKRVAYQIIIARDIDKFTMMLSNDITSLENWIKNSKIKGDVVEEASRLVKKMKNTTARIKKNIGEELKDIN
jgi:hypothetical protein